MSTKKKPDEKVADPLEAVKVSSVEKAPAQKTLPEPAKSSEPVKAPVTTPAKKPRKNEPPPVVPEPVENKWPVYKILSTISISWNGQIIRLKEGGNVSEATHGSGAIKRMINAGVALKEVTS